MSACATCGKDHDPLLARGDAIAAAMRQVMADLEAAEKGPAAVSPEIVEAMRSAQLYQRLCGGSADTVEEPFRSFLAGAQWERNRAARRCS